MLEKPPQSAIIPSDLMGILTWVWVVGLSLLGGLTSFLRKVKDGHARAWNFTELVGELTASGLTGIITYNLCAWRGLDQQLTAGLVGIAAHMGSRALFKLEAIFDKNFPVPAPKDPPHET